MLRGLGRIRTLQGREAVVAGMAGVEGRRTSIPQSLEEYGSAS